MSCKLVVANPAHLHLHLLRRVRIINADPEVPPKVCRGNREDSKVDVHSRFEHINRAPNGVYGFALVGTALSATSSCHLVVRRQVDQRI